MEACGRLTGSIQSAVGFVPTCVALLHFRTGAPPPAVPPADLYIAAKAPRPGLAKTRLGEGIGPQPAADLYAAFLQDLGARFPNAAWYVTPDDGWGEIRRLVAADTSTPPVVAQPDGDWTHRQRHLFKQTLADAERPVILIASDSPQLTADYVQAAARALATHDLVLGPTLDGGYALIGMRAWHDVLSGVSMSTADVLQGIVARATDLGLTTALLPATFDIDLAGDLDHLRAALAGRDDLPATAAVLRRLVAA